MRTDRFDDDPSSISMTGVNPEDVRIVEDYTEALVSAVRGSDASSAAMYARTVQDHLVWLLEALDPEGVSSAAITHSNGQYRGAPSPLTNRITGGR